MTRKFRVRIDYFKESGKWYSDVTTDRECRTCGDEGRAAEIPYTPDLVAWIRGLRDTGSQLPGLSDRGNPTEPSWEGPILIRTVGYYTPGVQLVDETGATAGNVETFIPDEGVPSLLLPR